MAELAKAYVQIIPSAKGIGKKIEEEVGGESVGSGIGNKLGAGLKKAFAAAAVGKFIKDSILEGANLEQNLGGTEAVFGQFAKTIQTQASDAYKNMGISASDYMSTANKMGSLFQGSGLSQQKSLELTSDAMQRAADVASVMGVDMSMAMESVAGAAKGNFTMMDNLGVAMNATTLEAYALEKGINFNWNTATQAEKSELAMKMFMDRTSQYAGNFAKESVETFQGSFDAMKGAWKNLLGSLMMGEGISAATANLSTTIINFAKNLIPAIVNILGDLPATIVSLLAQVIPALIPLVVQGILDLTTVLVESLPIIIDAVMQLLTGIMNGLLAAIPMIIVVLPQIISSLINGLLAAIPQLVQCGIDLLTALVQALPTIITSITTVMPQVIQGIIATLLSQLPLIIQCGINLLIALIDALPAIIAAITAVLPQLITGITTTLIRNIPAIIQCGITLFVALIKALPQIIASLVRAVPQIVTSLVKALGDNVSAFVTAGTDMIVGLGKGFVDGVGKALKKVKKACKNVVDSVLGFFKIKSPSRIFVEIGKFLPAGLAKGVTDNFNVVDRAMTKLGAITTGKFETQIAMNAKAINPNLNMDTAELKEKQEGTVVYQTIKINDVVKTPAETARALRAEAVRMGLAGI